MYCEYDTTEVAQKLCEITNNEEFSAEVEEALYQIKVIADNKYNCDYWRTFYKVLSTICEYDY